MWTRKVRTREPTNKMNREPKKANMIRIEYPRPVEYLIQEPRLYKTPQNLQDFDECKFFQEDKRIPHENTLNIIIIW